MPFTPFHFGPGGAIKAICPRRFSFTVFVAAQVITDLEPAYYMILREPPLHRWTHTYAGAVAIAVLTALLVGPFVRVAHRLIDGWRVSHARWFSATRHSWGVILASAFVGTFSHVFLDSIMHRDMHPFAPFSGANPMLRVIDLGALHLACLALGLIAFLYALIRPPKPAFRREAAQPRDAAPLPRNCEDSATAARPDLREK